MDQDMKLQEFLKWEATTRDTIDFKRIYADIANGDVLAGLVLSELVFWYLPTKSGTSKLRCFHDGILWIAARRYEWWDRCRITPNQADRAIGILIDSGVVEKKIYKFNGEPTIHLRLLPQPFLDAMQKSVDHPKENPFTPKTNSATAENEIGSSRIPVTETTTEDTTTLPTPSEEPSQPSTHQEERKKIEIPAGSDMAWEMLAGDSSEAMATTNEKIRFAKEATDAFEKALVFNPLPWAENAKWTRFQKFVVEEYRKNPTCFVNFQSKRLNEGQYTRLPANPKIYQDPDLFIAIWPGIFENESHITKADNGSGFYG